MKRKTITALREALQDAYDAMDDTDPEWESGFHRATGEYIGLRKAYSIVTGQDLTTIGNEVARRYLDEHKDTE